MHMAKFATLVALLLMSFSSIGLASGGQDSNPVVTISPVPAPAPENGQTQGEGTPADQSQPGDRIEIDEINLMGVDLDGIDLIPECIIM